MVAQNLAKMLKKLHEDFRYVSPHEAKKNLRKYIKANAGDIGVMTLTPTQEYLDLIAKDRVFDALSILFERYYVWIEILCEQNHTNSIAWGYSNTKDTNEKILDKIQRKESELAYKNRIISPFKKLVVEAKKHSDKYCENYNLQAPDFVETLSEVKKRRGFPLPITSDEISALETLIEKARGWLWYHEMDNISDVLPADKMEVQRMLRSFVRMFFEPLTAIGFSALKAATYTAKILNLWGYSS